MGIWDSANQAAGAPQPIQSNAPSGAQSGAWAGANARAAASIPKAQPTKQQAIESVIMGKRAASTSNYAPGPRIKQPEPFFEGTTISAAPPKGQQILLKEPKKYGPAPTIFDWKDFGRPGNETVKLNEGDGAVKRVAGTAVNAIVGAVEHADKRLGTFLDAFFRTPEQYNTAEKVGSVVGLAEGAAQAYFSPVAAASTAAEELPVIGKPIFGTVNKLFGWFAELGSNVAGGVVNIAPLPESTKQALMEPVQSLGSLGGVLLGGKALAKVGGKAGSAVVDKLPISEVNKSRIKTTAKTVTDVAQDPLGIFASAYSAAVKVKTEARIRRGETITPEVADVIVNQAVKEVPVESEGYLTVPTPEGNLNLHSNQLVVLRNLIHGREDITYETVKDLGADADGKPIQSQFVWNYDTRKGTIRTTNKATAVSLAHELGHYVDRRLGAALNVRLSDVLPNYRENRDTMNQMLADYALETLGGNATKAQIDAEIMRVAESLKQDISVVTASNKRKAEGDQFAKAFAGVLDNPKMRTAAPELSRLVDFTVGQSAMRSGAKADLEGAPGSVAEKGSIVKNLEQSKKSMVKEALDDPAFLDTLASDAAKAESVAAKGELVANYGWKETVKAMKNSTSFRKEGMLDNATFDGVIMSRNGRDVLVAKDQVKEYAAKGYVQKITMDEIAAANGFPSAEDYATYVMELDAESRAINRSPVQKKAHEFLMKNDANYAKLNETLEALRTELVAEEAGISKAEPGDAGEAQRAPESSGEEVATAVPTAEAVVTDAPVTAAKPAKQAALDPVIAPATQAKNRPDKVKQSRVFDRLKAEMPEELSGDASYTQMNMQKDVENAVKLVESDRAKAYRVAMGLESIEGQTSTAVNIAMADMALESGNSALYAQLTKARSLEQTRRGQEIVAEKGSVSDNSTSRFVKELIAERMAILGKVDFGDVRTLLKKESVQKRAVKKIDEQVQSAQKEIKKNRSKRFGIEEAQKLIDSLACN